MTASYCLNYLDTTLEIRATANRTISGVVVPYERWQRVKTTPDSDQRRRRFKRGRRAPNVPGSFRFREKVKRKAIKAPNLDDAFDQAFDEAGGHNIRALINHDPDQFLGDVASRSLRLKNTDRSLNFELDLPETDSGNKILSAITNKSDRKLRMSIGFKRRGKKSNIKKVTFADGDLIEPDELRARVQVMSSVDFEARVPDQLQDGLLDGSDYVEGLGITDNGDISGYNWRVYFNLDVREVSVLTPNVQPAWEGTVVELGSGDPMSNPAYRERELLLARLA